MTDQPQKKHAFLQLRLRLTGLISAAGAIGCVATFCGFLGSLAWFLDLFSHFRVQYFFGLSLIAGLEFACRHRKTAACFLLAAVVNLCTIIPLYLGGSHGELDSQPPIRALLINVNRRFGSAARLEEVLRRFDSDIVVLLEVDDRWLSALSSTMSSYPYSKTQPRQDSFGIALYSKLPLERAGIEYLGHADVPSVLAEVDSAHGNFEIIATHPLPPTSRSYSLWRNEQLNALAERVRLCESPVLVLGDLNASPWSYHFQRLLKRSGLRDSARGYGFQPTWPSQMPLLLIPIDHCLHSEEIRVQQRQIGPYVMSDHYPVIVDFTLPAK